MSARPAKFAVKFGAGLCVCGGGGFFGCEEAEVDVLAMYLDASAPTRSLLVPRDTFGPAGVVGWASLVAEVFGDGGEAEICAPVVQPVAVDVVNVQRRPLRNKKPVQVVKPTRGAGGNCHRIAKAPPDTYEPTATRDQRNVRSVDQRGVALRKGNKGDVAFNPDGPYLLISHVRSSHDPLVRAGRGGTNSYRPALIPHSEAEGKQ